VWRQDFSFPEFNHVDPRAVNASAQSQTPRTVSFDHEPLILVDEDGTVTGYAEKQAVHQGSGLLHLAFSVFLRDEHNRIMLHKRSRQKPLWPGFWTNSCCSHPRRNETLEAATARRLDEELGISCELRYLYTFNYRAHYLDVGSEYERCSVYLGSISSDVIFDINPTEIEIWDWFDVEAIESMLVEHPDTLSPWFKLEWPRVKTALLGQF